MILSDILFQLERIANSLEAISNTKLEKGPTEKAPPAEFFDTRLKVNEDFLDVETRIVKQVREKMYEMNSKGFFFEEDGLSEEMLEKL